MLIVVKASCGLASVTLQFQGLRGVGHLQVHLCPIPIFSSQPTFQSLKGQTIFFKLIFDGVKQDYPKWKGTESSPFGTSGGCGRRRRRNKTNNEDEREREKLWIRRGSEWWWWRAACGNELVGLAALVVSCRRDWIWCAGRGRLFFRLAALGFRLLGRLVPVLPLGGEGGGGGGVGRQQVEGACHSWGCLGETSRKTRVKRGNTSLLSCGSITSRSRRPVGCVVWISCRKWAHQKPFQIQRRQKNSVATLLLDLVFNFNLCGLFKIVLTY